jgi:hypothetical protein
MHPTNCVSALESANQLLQHQTNLLVGFAGVLIGMFLIILGISWYWNKTRIRHELENYLETLFANYREDQSTVIKELIDKELATSKEELKETIKYVGAEVV